MIKLAAVGSPLGLPGRGTDVDQTWNSRGSDVELTWIRCGTVCGRAVSSVGRAVELNSRRNPGPAARYSVKICFCAFILIS